MSLAVQRPWAPLFFFASFFRSLVLFCFVLVLSGWLVCFDSFHMFVLFGFVLVVSGGLVCLDSFHMFALFWFFSGWLVCFDSFHMFVLSTKTECDYLNGWIKKRSHTQKSHPKVVNPRDIAGERKKKKKKKKSLFCFGFVFGCFCFCVVVFKCLFVFGRSRKGQSDESAQGMECAATLR